MALDPHAQAILQALSAMPAVDFSTVAPQAYRALMAAGAGMFAPGDTVARIEDREIPGPGGPLRVRLYYPDGNGPFPITVYFHGGGFVICDLDSHDNICRCLARRARSLIISVDYRRAPEARFPAAVDDAIAALRWAHAHAPELGADADRIAVAGDSSGGNLAAVAAQHARVHGPHLCHQLLLYPVTDCAAQGGSFQTLAEGYYLTAEMMRWFLGHYLSDPGAAQDARASPLRAKDLHGLPPATIFTAEFDPLRDQGEAYAEALAAAGVDVARQRWPGQIHGFISMLGAIGAADQALERAAQSLHQGFARVPAAA